MAFPLRTFSSAFITLRRGDFCFDELFHNRVDRRGGLKLGHVPRIGHHVTGNSGGQASACVAGRISSTCPRSG